MIVRNIHNFKINIQIHIQDALPHRKCVNRSVRSTKFGDSCYYNQVGG